MDVKRYIAKCRARGASERTIKNIINNLNIFNAWRGDREITEDLILDYTDFLQNYTYGKKKKKYTPLTIFQMKSVLRTYLDSEYPEINDPIKLKMPKRKLPHTLLKEEDIEKLLAVCLHPRDLALISFLYESGCRKGELLALRNHSIAFDEYGAVVTFPESKTGSRRIRVVYSASYLRAWKEVHPRKNDDEAFFFCSLRTPDRPLSETGLHNQLKDLTERAGIKKTVYPHLFRHSAATRLATQLSEQSMKAYLGWTAGSSMAATYVHLAGEDTDDEILRIYGVEAKEKKRDKLAVIKCPRCKEIMPEKALFCNKCGLPLQEATAKEIEDGKIAVDMAILEAVATNPAVLQEIAARVAKLQKNN